MRAICPTCDTAYTIPDERIGAQGRKVRCVKCGEQWRVMPEIEQTAASADAPAPRRESAIAVDKVDVSVAESTEAEPDRAAAIDEDHWASVAQHFEGGGEADGAEPAEAAPPAVDAATASVDPAPKASTEGAGARTVARFLPRLPNIRRSLKPKLPRTSFALPRMPVAMTRAVPFFGPLVFVSAILVVAGLFGFRTKIVAAAPGLAGFYAMAGLDVNLRGLTFGPIETLREIDNGQPVLVVEGTLANPTKQERDVPALRFALRDADTQELYAWSIDPKATVIAAGDSLRYRTRLVAPPDRATDLQVRFVERRNHQAGLK